MVSRSAWLGSLCLLVVSVSAISGCHDPAKGKADAGGSAPKKVEAVSVGENDVIFELNADNTDIKWTASNVSGQSPYGYFFELSGRGIYDRSTDQLKSIEIEINMASVKAQAEALTKKLKHQGFFEVDTYPKSKFVSTSISEATREGDPAGTTHVIEGNFQLRDVTRSIQIPVQLNVSADQLKLKSEFKINRKDYGVLYSDSAGDALIRDEVLLEIDLTATP